MGSFFDILKKFAVAHDWLTGKHLKASVNIGTTTHYTKEGQLDCAFVIGTSPAAANSEVTIKHPLGRVPEGYIVVWKDKPGGVYRGANKTAWSNTTISVHCVDANTTVHLLVW